MTVIGENETVENAVRVVTDVATMYIPLGEMSRRRAGARASVRRASGRSCTQDEIRRVQSKLDNAEFVAKAPRARRQRGTEEAGTIPCRRRQFAGGAGTAWIKEAGGALGAPCRFFLYAGSGIGGLACRSKAVLRASGGEVSFCARRFPFGSLLCGMKKRIIRFRTDRRRCVQKRRFINMPTIGERIAELRRKSGMTQEELASLLGISAQSVSKWGNRGNYAGYSAAADSRGRFRRSNRRAFRERG